MKYFLLSLTCFLLFACTKDVVNVNPKILPMESISGIVHVDGVPASDQVFNVFLLDIFTDSSGTQIDTLAISETVNGLYVFDQIIPSEIEHFIYIDDYEGLNFEYGLDESPDGDPHDETNVGRTLGVILESDEIDSDNNYYFTTITAPCPTVVSGYVYIVDVFGVQFPSAFMDIHLSERLDNGEPTGIIYQFGETNESGYYEFIVDEANEFVVKPSILDYPFLFTELEETIIIDESPDDDPVINIDEGFIDVDVDSCEIDDQNNFYFHLKNIPSQITGNVLIDFDSDGIMDAGKGHMRVELFYRDASGEPIGTKIDHKFTDADGAFKFTNVEDGEYVLVLKKNALLDITASYDENNEPGEPINPVINYISVNLENGISDHFNLFTLENHEECDIELSIIPYWALCDTNTTCQLDEVPLVIVDMYLNPILLLNGLSSLSWNNLTTGQTSSSDIVFWRPNDLFDVELTLLNGCTYNLTYKRECAQDFEGELSLIQKDEGSTSTSYTENDIIWSIHPTKLELNITYNVSQPTDALNPGEYNYTIDDDLLSLIDINGITYEIGEITYDGAYFVLEDDSGSEVIQRKFSKL